MNLRPRVDFNPAKKWNELNPWQLSIIGKILYSDRAMNKKVYQFFLLVVLMMVKPLPKNIIKVIYLFSLVPFQRYFELTNFIFDEDDHLSKFYKTIKVGPFYNRKTLYGPNARLSNITITELSYADGFFYNWITNGKTVDLQRLVACLYRETSNQTTAVDRRVPFDKLLLPENATLTDKIPLHKMYIIALGYQGSRHILINRYKNVFPVRKTKEEEVPVTKKKKAYHSFTKIIQSLAMDEIQVFGPMQQTEKTLATDFLSAYDELILRERNKK